MLLRIGVYGPAALLIEVHGDDAVLEAALKADAMLEKGDLDAKRVWRATINAIAELQRTAPKDGEWIK